MTEFSPRVVQILFILLNRYVPVPVEELARELKISKRTVFREMESVNRQLLPYGVQIQSVKGQGLLATGEAERRKELLELLENSDSFDPKNRQERQKKLIWMLLQEEEENKLFYYADTLHVSETTISNDLDAVGEWLDMYGIRLERKSGVGIGIDYTEAAYRKAVLAYVVEFGEPGAFDEKTRQTLILILNRIRNPILTMLTKASFDELVRYLDLVIDRIRKQRYLFLDEQEKRIGKDPAYNELAEQIRAEVEETWLLTFTIDEKTALYTFIRGRKLRDVLPGSEAFRYRDISIDLRMLVNEMINAYDGGMAYELKQDDDFICGIMSHLRPTILNMIQKLPVNNPLLEDIREKYPEIYGRTVRAAEVLERQTGFPVPDAEIGYLALHFGGALTRIEQRKKKKRKVRAAVVCVNGIGITNLLKARLVHEFGERLEITILTTETLWHEDVAFADFVISTIPLEQSPLSVIQVSPMITEQEMQVIRDAVERAARTAPRRQRAPQLQNSVSLAIRAAGEISSILSHFRFYRVRKDISYEEVLEMIGRVLGDTEERAAGIIEAIREREEIATQVVPEYEIALFHARTDAVEDSRFIVIHPEEGNFTDPFFHGIRAILVMLINRDDYTETKAMSAVSSELFDREDFLEDILEARQEKVRKRLEEVLNEYFTVYIHQMMEGKEGTL